MDGQINNNGSAINTPLPSTGEQKPQEERKPYERFLYAARMKRPLTGCVIAVRDPDSISPVCVVSWKGLRIDIPGREMFPEQWPEGEPAPKNIRTRLMRIRGADVDFLPKALEAPRDIGYGSRREAMSIKAQEYFDTGKVSAGTYVTCRVVGVGNSRVRAEVFGVETELETSQLSWDWFVDVRDVFHTGQALTCVVRDVHRGEDGKWAVRLSRKMACCKDGRNLRKLIPHCTYLGTVTGVRDGLYFVRLQEGANAKTKLCWDHNPPQRGDQVVFLVRSVDLEKYQALGLITHVVHRRADKEVECHEA